MRVGLPYLVVAGLAAPAFAFDQQPLDPLKQLTLEELANLEVVTATAIMYPDVLVICRPLAPDDDRVPDPTVVVEVLSPTTETHDRIRKWREYQSIAVLQHFVLVAQSERRVEVYSRTQTGWEIKVVEPPEDAVVLKAIGTRLSLEAIYQRSGR